MREIVIIRPKRMEAAVTALKVEVDGKDQEKLKNGQTVKLMLDDTAHTIRLHGGFMSGKNFQDQQNIPAGTYGYSLQVDMMSDSNSTYRPMMRPCGQERLKDENRTITLMGSVLCKLLMDDKLRDMLRKLPEAKLCLAVLPAEWKLLLCVGTVEKEVFHSQYSQHVGSLMATMMTSVEHVDLKTEEGRAKMCDKVLRDYAAYLPEYTRDGADCLVFKG